MNNDNLFARHGFLPAEDPLVRFDDDSELSPLDTLGQDLPSMLQDRGFRRLARTFQIPRLPDGDVSRRELQLYYVRVAFLASAYVHQVGEETANVLPKNLAIPLCEVCERLGRPPILSYDGYALYNWKRFDREGPIALGNIDSIQNFVHLYDERWFIVVHVEIEALAAGVLGAILAVEQAFINADFRMLDEAIAKIVRTLREQVRVLRRVAEKMDPSLYYKTFRPYIRFFEKVVYEGIATVPMNYRGETGAQSCVIPILVAFLKIPHERSGLTDHLADMRRFMPAEHRALIERVEAMPPIRDKVDKTLFNEAIDALATFREVHRDLAVEYISRYVEDPRGTGGTLYLDWLGQLANETRAYKIA